MRDRRDYIIAALAAALCFALGAVVSPFEGESILPEAGAQDGGFDPEQPVAQPDGPTDGGGGLTPTRDVPPIRPGFEGRTVPPTASDSDSNNRFVAVSSPMGSGESVLFVLDAKTDHIVVYRYRRGKGLYFLAGRRIDYDLKINGYQDQSEYTRDEMKSLYEKQIARAKAEALKQARKPGKG